MPLHSLNHFKSVFIYDIFIQPADQNYLTARFLRVIGMHQDFFWHAQQTLEKLFKAGLVLNGVSVKSKSHELTKLLPIYEETLGSDAFNSFDKPKKLKAELWSDTSVKDFVTKISALGSADARYGLVGYQSSKDDLFKLDQLVFKLRQRTMGLDWVIGEDFRAEENLQHFNGKTYREFIEQNPTEQIRHLSIPYQELKSIGENTQDLFHAWNFEFQRKSSDIDKIAPGAIAPELAFSLSRIDALLQNIEAFDGFDKEFVPEGFKWLLDNVKVSSHWKKMIETYLSESKK
ncbi:hypothetical protein BFP76_02695 [Amylibacter kogurei]|uniref:HEPN domain-containing protein n=1 Tax=Paramylibacter kogurei TaxID=1889778 RepID=A0A2G5K852_9RHOB|nr:hypothetical protein [Amylibacter kogurei]PIB25060.1 hypothetical protein BFP76_02695 [Amylibacter kogurei]